jgi:high-affinity Fe2+/Pb2+ permease
MWQDDTAQGIAEYAVVLAILLMIMVATVLRYRRQRLPLVLQSRA